jgi:hypothetical protein
MPGDSGTERATGPRWCEVVEGVAAWRAEDAERGLGRRTSERVARPARPAACQLRLKM